MGDVVIDLDSRPPDAPAPSMRRPAVPRIVRLFAVLVLTVATLGAATVPPDDGLRLILTAGGTPAAAFELGAGALYTATYDLNNPNGESGVRRFDLATGREVWARPLPQNVQNLMISDEAGVLMARSDRGTSFLSAETGEPLWSVRSVNTAAVTLSREGVLLTSRDPGPTVLRLADAWTGATVWVRRVDAAVFFGPDVLWQGDPRRVVAVGADGVVVVLDFATGREVARGALPGPLRPVYEPESDGMLVGTVGENRLVVRGRAAGRVTMTTYALEPFAKLWERTAAPAGLATDCGVVWCVSSPVPRRAGNGEPAGVGLSAIDPDSGMLRWYAPGVTFAAPFGDGTLLGGDGSEIAELLLLDQETGRVLRRYGRSVRVGDLLLYADTALPGRTWVQTVDRSGRVHVGGPVDVGAPYGCEQLDAYLACPTTGGPTKVWRVPEPDPS